MEQEKAVTIISVLIFLLGILNALSFGPLSHITILNYSIFDFMCMLTDNILMPFGGILMCIYIGWLWKPEFIVNHVEEEGIKFRFKKAWLICIRFITPILVVIVTLVGLINVYNMINM